jgi:hypothetical protein
MMKDTVTRVNNAHEGFINSLVESFNLSKEDAEKVLAIFKGAKVVKLYANIGRYEIVHGGYWSESVCNAAINLYNTRNNETPTA